MRLANMAEHALPSGNATIYAAVMTREGRGRDDNVPQRPNVTFPGDWRDTDALKQWIARTVLGGQL